MTAADVAGEAAAGGDDLQAAVHESLDSVPRADWNALSAGDVENWDFYRAVEGVPPQGVTLGALTVRRGERLIAAAPVFAMSYRLDTPFQGGLARQCADWISARWPRATSLPVLAVGSPFSDNCSLAFASGLDERGRDAALAAALDRLQREAAARGSALIALKSIGAISDGEHAALLAAGYARVTSVPVATLELPYRDLDDYLSALPKKTGGYLRRKLRTLPQVRIEYRSSAADLEPRLIALYDATLAQSGVSYGELDRIPPGYLSGLLDRLGPAAKLMLCWQGEELVSFQMFLVGERRIIALKIGMKYPDARQLNLYFINWLKMIEFALEARIPEIEMGATTYAAKMLLGGQLDRRWLYFRWRGEVANRLLWPAARFFDFECNDPELTALHGGSRYTGRERG